MKTIEFNIENLELLKSKLYHFANQYDLCYALDSNSNDSACNENVYEFLLGLGLKRRIEGDLESQLNQSEESPYWKFTSIPYGLLKDIHSASVFEPQVVFAIEKNATILSLINNGIETIDFQKFISDFEAFQVPSNLHHSAAIASFEANTSEINYVKQIEQIREDIYQGCYYELNYCIEYKAPFVSDNLLPIFLELNAETQAPFAAYIKEEQFSMLCSSPERFIKREGDVLLSQPIKGTNKRLPKHENEAQLEALRSSVKERAENVMIVDLVRNDMAKVSLPATVKVLELCAPYAYKSVNHLVSSIQSKLTLKTKLSKVFEALFPMGSMTGAPKTEVMKHILEYENTERGYYSGCIGYIAPNGDFDFNVCIRTLIYKPQLGEISYKVGSAITYDSCPEQEYEECLIKGSRMLSVFQKH